MQKVIRVIWKDAAKAKQKKPVKYRGHYATGCTGGWVTDIPGDMNIYKSHYCALNAIDEYLGGVGQMGYAKRINYGIQVVGTKADATA